MGRDLLQWDQVLALFNRYRYGAIYPFVANRQSLNLALGSMLKPDPGSRFLNLKLGRLLVLKKSDENTFSFNFMKHL